MTRVQTEKKILETHLYTETKGGLRIKNPVTLVVSPTEIEFKKSPFHLKNEIKSMMGARWHGYDREKPRKVWTVDNCERNWFQLKYMMGGDPYEWFERKLITHEYDKPLMEHQAKLCDIGLTFHYQIWAAEMGTGKLGRLTTPILTPTGWTMMGELTVGSRLIDPSGGTCKVISLHPQGQKEVFKVTFTDGSSTDCGAEHLWRVTTPLRKWRGKDWQVFELQELVSRGLQHSNGNNKWFIPMVEPVQFDVRNLKCHPYVMGYILGNGHLPAYQVSVPDQETIDRLNSFMSELMTPTSATVKGEKIDYTIRCQSTRDAIDDYKLKECRSNSKFVPEDFLFNTLENRLLLMQGLLDSDGSPLNTSGIEFSSASTKLASSMVFLIQSFGGTYHRGLREKPVYTYKSESYIGQPSHRVHGSFDSRVVPFLLSRKADLYMAPTKYEPTRAIVSVESVGTDECICIRVNSPTHCYVTDEFIVTHNTLAAQELMEQSGCDQWFWVGPLKSLENIEREWEKWNLSLSWDKPKDGNALVESVRRNEHHIYLTTYERLVKFMETRLDSDPIPAGVIFDESSRLKSPATKRSKAAQDLSDMIRATYGIDSGYVILMSGTPSPKSPLDWWRQAEIAWPGYLKEGSKDQLETRLGFMVKQELPDNVINVRMGWRDNSDKCVKCTKLKDEGAHEWDIDNPDAAWHDFEKSKDEVSYMYERLAGLVTVVHKKDVLDLPDKVYEIDRCEPSPSTLRVAKTIAKGAPNVMTGITWLRELSDGFMYKNVPDGISSCPTCSGSEQPGKVKAWFDPDGVSGEPIRAIDMLEQEYVDTLEEKYIACPRCKGTCQVTKTKRIAREVPCPKEAKLKARLAQCEEAGRIIVFAGFQGSIDRIRNICRKEGWDVVQVDGRGWKVMDKTGKSIRTDKPLHYWSDTEHHQQVAFVAHPASGGLSLNLTEARMAVYWSNDFSPESRSQSEDRIHRKGMDENKGCKIVDIYHLPTDEKTHKILKSNRKLELITMGEISQGLDD